MAEAIKNDAITGAWIKLGLALVFAAIGCWVVYLAVTMVGVFGAGMGVDERSRQIYSSAHIAVHLFGTASAVAITLFVVNRNKTLAVLALAAIITCGGYGIVNMIGFTTTNRLSVSEQKVQSTAADWTHYEAKKKAIQSEIEWARSTAVQEDSPREKRRLLARVDAKLKELAAIEPPRPTNATALADPQATWFSRLTNSSSENWQLALPVPVAVLLFAAEVLCFVFAVHLIVGAVAAFRQAGIAKRDPPKSDTGGGKKLELVKPDARDPVDAPKKIHASAHLMHADPQQRSASVPSTGAKKMSDADLSEYLRQKANSGLSQRAKAHELRALGYVGVSQPQISRKSRRIEEQAARKAARISARRSNGHHGFGGGLHAPAIG